MTITIDTSIFLELILDQERSKESKSLLDAIADGEIEAVVSHFALHAIEATIRSSENLSEFLKDVENSKGLKIYDTSLSDERNISTLSEKIGLDFNDSVQFYVAKLTSSSSIVSFDKHFDGSGIPRREPSEILANLQNRSKHEN